MRLFPSRPRRPESYYRGRRDDLAAGVAIAAGIFAALVRGAQQWLLIVRGVRHLDPAHGLFNFMWVVVKAACAGALAGFAVGWTLGFVWEYWHRRRRAKRQAA
jgi:membrane associated rhomboid family serine protease